MKTHGPLPQYQRACGCCTIVPPSVLKSMALDERFSSNRSMLQQTYMETMYLLNPVRGRSSRVGC